MNEVIRVGTRKSALAVAQAMIAVDCMKAAAPEKKFELVYKTTAGDRILDRPLLSFGGKGVFVSEFEEALLTGEIDFAVHSAKDLPMELADGLAIVGVPKREDPRDVLIVPRGTDLKVLERIVIGTSSLRRKVLIESIGKRMWPGIPVVCENLRGNVQTRLGKLQEGGYDAIILAAAGLKRLGLHETKEYDLHYFECGKFIPAGGQGILAVEGRLNDPVCHLAEQINDNDTLICLNLERRVLKLLNAGCHEPVGVYAEKVGEALSLSVMYPSGGNIKFIRKDGLTGDAEAMAEVAVRELIGHNGER